MAMLSALLLGHNPDAHRTRVLTMYPVKATNISCGFEQRQRAVAGELLEPAQTWFNLLSAADRRTLHNDCAHCSEWT